MHLIKRGSGLTVAEAASIAIRSWIAREAQAIAAPSESEQGAQLAHAAEPSPTRGYQWKDLFLPEGTELRMSSAGHAYHARVTGDAIIYKSRTVSPRGFTLAVAGNGRNAWRDVWIRFVGERHYLPASRCRRDQQQLHHQQQHQQPQHQQPQQQPSRQMPACEPAVPASTCADSLNAAVLTMSEVLKTTLALMERVKARAMHDDERRIQPPRREIDVLAGDCAFD